MAPRTGKRRARGHAGRREVVRSQRSEFRQFYGNAIVNVAPDPGSLLTSSRPPVKSTMRQALERPRPRPRPASRPEKKGSKMCGRIEGGMPGPVSVTDRNNRGVRSAQRGVEGSEVMKCG